MVPGFDVVILTKSAAIGAAASKIDERLTRVLRQAKLLKMAKIALFLIYFYQKTLSLDHGPMKGFFLMVIAVFILAVRPIATDPLSGLG